MFPYVDGKGFARGNTELGGHVLDDDKHKGAECDYPKKLITESRASFNVGGPVAGVYEADRDKESWSQKSENRSEREGPGGIFAGNHIRPVFRYSAILGETGALFICKYNIWSFI